MVLDSFELNIFVVTLHHFRDNENNIIINSPYNNLWLVVDQRKLSDNNNCTIITHYRNRATILLHFILFNKNSSVNKHKCVGTRYICYARYSSCLLQTPEANSPLVIPTTASVKRWIALFATFILMSGINSVSRLTSRITRRSLELWVIKRFWGISVNVPMLLQQHFPWRPCLKALKEQTV